MVVIPSKISIIFLLGSILFSLGQDCDCTKYVDSLWQIKPTKEGQLSATIQKFESNYGKTQHYPSRQELFNVLYHKTHSPYEGLDAGPREEMSYFSFAERNAKIIKNFVTTTLGGPPRFVLEVGTFIGNGAIIVWGSMMKQRNDSFLLCIDTWEGDVNMRLGPQFQDFMSMKHGMPSLYNRFMRRIVHNHLNEYIYPLPMASLPAARLLASFHWIIDVIYLDSAHEIGETFAELYLYFQLVRSGGILMGDDYATFPAVKHDVDLFVAYKGSKELTFKLIEANQWAILKI